MLTATLGHATGPVRPHDVWTAWGRDPLVLVGLLAVVALYARGRRRRPDRFRRRDAWFALGMTVVALALLSPLERAASALASAHMVQHVLLVVVAAPLLAAAAPLAPIGRALPLGARVPAALARRRAGLTRARLERMSHPVGVALLHAGVVWLWHSPVLYDAAVAHGAVHALEHATFLGTAVLFWRVVVGAPRARPTVPGTRVLLVFGVAMLSVFLAVLLTFASSPWYASYRATAPAWGIDALTDQHLAGVIMWVPAGMAYVAAAIAVLAAWLADIDRAAAPTAPGFHARRGTP